MTKKTLFIVPGVLLCANAANAADTNFLVTGERTSFSGSFGERFETGVQSTTDLGSTAFTMHATHGKRKFDSETYKSTRFGGSLYHDWNEKFFTRSSAAISSNSPVFATREIAHDFNYKLFPNAVATVGGKYARYFGGRDALSWSMGASWYFSGGQATYRFSQYHVDKLGSSTGHLASLRLKDGKGAGSTQLWAGLGTSLHEHEALIGNQAGKFRSLAVRRVQPVAGPVALDLTLGRTWYDTPGADYRGTTASVGFSITRLPKF